MKADIASSFLLDGQEIVLRTGEMISMENGVYETAFPGGLTAALETASGEDWDCVLLTFRNDGTAPTGQLSRIRTLDLAIPAGSLAWHSFKGDSCGAESYNPLDTVFGEGEKLHVEPYGGRACNISMLPFFDVTAGSDTWAIGIGWLGQWCMDISVENGVSRVQTGLADADLYLLPGEKIRTLRVLIVHGNDPADTRRRFRRVMLEHFSPRTRLGDRTKMHTSYQPFDRYFYNENCEWYRDGSRRKDWNTEAGQKQSADAAEKLRYVDTLWLDAAWFREGFPYGVGNYEFTPGFPNGLRPVTDYAHEKGLDFALWFEPERVNVRSDTARDHRDMLLSCPEMGDNYLFNLADDRARAWLTDTLITFIRENGIDIYRQDFNMETLPYWRANDASGRKGMTEIRYVTGHYQMWDDILAAFPGIRIDNCSSGGRRIELETCIRAFPMWRSDTGCSPMDLWHRTHTWNQNHILALTEYIPFHACATWEEGTYYLRSVYSGAVACNFDALNPDYDFDSVVPRLEELKRVQKYWQGDFYPLTEATNYEKIWAAWQLTLGDEGIVCAFRRDRCAESEQTYTLNAIDRDAQYRVRVTDEHLHTEESILTGKELEKYTFRTEKPLESVLLEYEKA